MRLPLPIDDLETASVEAAVAAIRIEWGFHKSWGFPNLLSDWERTVEQLARGYELTFENYTRDLSIRDEIEQLVSRVPPLLANRINAWLQPLDVKFFEYTVAVEEPALPPLGQETLSPRWYRMPANLRSVDHDVAATWRR
jgi:hypothetical protein